MACADQAGGAQLCFEDPGFVERRPRRRAPGQRGDSVHDHAQVARLGPAVDDHEHLSVRPGDPTGLAQRLEGVGGEPERREARHGVEARVGVAEGLQVSDGEGRLGHVHPGQLEQRGRRVEPAHPRPAIGGGAQERPGAAAEVEDVRGRAEQVQRRLVGRPVLALVLSPSGGVRTPEIAHGNTAFHVGS